MAKCGIQVTVTKKAFCDFCVCVFPTISIAELCLAPAAGRLPAVAGKTTPQLLSPRVLVFAVAGTDEREIR